MSTRPSRLATLLLLLALVVPIAQSAPVYGAPGGPPGPTQSKDRPATRPAPERWITRLAGPPLAQAPGIAPEFVTMAQGTPASNRLQLDSPAAQQYRARLEQQQAAVFAALRRSFST